MIWERNVTLGLVSSVDSPGLPKSAAAHMYWPSALFMWSVGGAESPLGCWEPFFNANMNVSFFQDYCFQPFVLVNRKNSVLFSSTASFQPQDPVSKSQSGSIVPCFSFTYNSPPGPSISMPMTPLMCSLALVYLDITIMRTTITITINKNNSFVVKLDARAPGWQLWW